MDRPLYDILNVAPDPTPDWVRQVCYLHTHRQVEECADLFHIDILTRSGNVKSRATLTSAIIRVMFA